MTRPTESLDAAYFERIYADSDDPWGFETRPYEREKYATTIGRLPRERYRRGLEIGCSIGVLTELLLGRCASLVSTDINARALARARERLAGRPGADLRLLNFPHDSVEGTFDLVVLSEVAYYWGARDFRLAQEIIVGQLLEPGGHLLLVHYTPSETDYPLTGDQVHARYHALTQGPEPSLRHVDSHRHALYSLDVYERR